MRLPYGEEIAPDSTRSFKELCAKLLDHYDHSLEEVGKYHQLGAFLENMKRRLTQVTQERDAKDLRVSEQQNELLFLNG